MAHVTSLDGSWLRAWRERLGVTAEQAARLLGYRQRASIVRLEDGSRPIDHRLALACMHIATMSPEQRAALADGLLVGEGGDGVLLEGQRAKMPSRLCRDACAVGQDDRTNPDERAGMGNGRAGTAPHRVERELKGRRILVVEDEALLRFLLEDLLNEVGCIVLSAAALDEAVNLAKVVDRLDAALLDINLGGETVFPVAYLLRERSVPFAFLTAYDASVLPPDLAGYPLLRKPYFGHDRVPHLLMKLLAPR
jgi:CheY-like chemotaxis protein